MLFSTSFKELSSFFIESLFCLTTATKERQISYTKMYNAIFLAKYVKQGLLLLSYLEGCHILQVPVNHQCADLQELCWILNEEKKSYSYALMLETGAIYTVIDKVQFQKLDRRDWNFLWVGGSGRPKYLLLSRNVCFQWGGCIHSIGGNIYFLELHKGKNKLNC